jgi:hypothetical protein
MEDISLLFEKLSVVFQNSFDAFIKNSDFSNIEKKELTNEYNAPLIDFCLINLKTGIQFESQYRPVRDYIYFHIRDIKNNKNISFDSYLKFKGYEKDNILSLNRIEGKDIPDKFKTYCDYVVRILDTDLKNVVKGKEWIDMPIDWMGYK